jgi:hypothetical protein
MPTNYYVAVYIESGEQERKAHALLETSVSVALRREGLIQEGGIMPRKGTKGLQLTK